MHSSKTVLIKKIFISANNNETTTNKKNDEPERKPSVGSMQLNRELGLFSAVNMILGVMIGSGIFVSPASALKESGSVAMCIIVWSLCGLISLLGMY